MSARSVWIATIFALCTMRTWALPVHLTFDWPVGAPVSAGLQVHIYAIRMAGAQESAAPVQADSGPNGSVLDLNEGVWLVQAFATGYWTEGAEVTVGGQSPSGARLAFWPAASLTGEVSPAPGEILPHTIDVKLTAHPASNNGQAAAQPQPGPAHAELICPISAGKWSCLGPAGLFDIRLQAEGYAPRYTWDKTLNAGAASDLGQTQLERSLSVFGRAVGKDGSAPPGPCRATLLPDAERGGGPGASSPDNPPPDEKAFTVPLSQQGYFQILGVMHGNHSLSVECPGASGFELVKVQPSGETRIDPLVLQELTLDIGLSPQMDPTGQPWRLTVDVTAPRLRRIADTANAAADGHWTRHGLMAGSYRVAVSSADGMEWLKQDFELGPDSKPLALRLAAVRVAGKVLLEGQPTRARLEFSNEDGGEPVTLNSDDSGRYAGLLPISPDAKETKWVVVAHVAHPLTVRRLVDIYVPTVAAGKTAPLDLELPAIPVRGIVVSEDNRPQRNAEVTFVAQGSGFQTAATTDGSGNFEMADLSTGSYTAVAQSDYGVSDPKPFAVTDSSENHLKLVMHPNLHVPFYVVAKDQEPIPDATVQVWIAPGVPKTVGHTNRDGRFEATLPPGTTEVGLTVGAEDYAINLTKMTVSSTPPANQTDGPQSQNTVTLDTQGGSLVLNYQPAEGTLDRSAALYLAHNGTIVDARTLAGWGTDQAGTNAEGPAEVDSIEPGDYALCVVTDPSQLTELWQGSTPQAQCSTGTVKQGSVLTLSPPSTTN